MRECDDLKIPNDGIIDFSKIELIPVNDTHTFINGVIKFPKGAKEPWKVHIYAEIYERSEWLKQAVNHHADNVCSTMFNPLYPSYPWTKTFPGCPLAENVSLKHSKFLI